jgi:ribosomal protein S18 acetylase RimI-like enzyme
MDLLIRLKPPEELERAARLLERAFADDPLMLYVLPNAKEREKRARWYYDANVKHAALFGEVWATPEFEGVATWLSPSKESHWSFNKLRQSGMWRIAEKLGVRASQRFMRSMNFDIPHEDELYWYLLLIGVEPEKHGQGIGSKLMTPMLARADSERSAIRLETNDERNLPFYRKHGFELIFEGHVPNGPGLWALRRGPQ